ncbi:MAG: tetratricopeptide repeat protein [Candidatus Obscuribacter sp.]|nr:tetratricopeptide repeat protein [Candidatus Obscuribacter sp.]
MTEHIQSGLGLTALILAALSLKLMFRYYKLMGQNMAKQSQFANGADEERAIKNYKLARELMRRDEFQGAFNYLKAAEGFLTDSGLPNMTLLSSILAQQSICIFRAGIGRAPDRDSLATAERACNLAYLSQNDRTILDARFARACILNGIGASERAEEELLQCLNLSQAVFGQTSVQEGRILLNLGQVKQEQGNRQEALSLYRQAASILAARTGKHSQETKTAEAYQALLLKRLPPA